MSEWDSMKEREPLKRPNLDGRVFGENGEPDVFIPGHLFPKVGFLVFSVLILLLGLWDLWGPASSVLFGEVSESRVAYMVRHSPGQADEVIRVRREIKEGDYGYETVFRHFVEVIDRNSRVQTFELAVASRQTPYALVNERVRVAYFPGATHAYGIYHHRTWAFGVSLLFMGMTFLPMAIFLVRMVGKPIPIDPEDPAELEKERRASGARHL
jgi:hypothetical protein